ncbi:MAG: hypothetical protein BWY11_01519 [Firmicutes bacterium ADurb.Bin182]|nr:MAG: hypothetical protein BWY11_01519 [Firmicutes bacterium ADurb.Bin182]
MKRDLKSIKKNKLPSMNAEDFKNMAKNPDPSMLNDFDPNLVANVQDTVGRYSQKSESELFEELKRVTGEQKRAGKLNNADIENAAAKLAPMLTPEQQRKMRSILQRLNQD